MHADLESFSLDGDAVQSVSRASTRDPRVDPQPGDVLAVGDDVREVQDRIGGTVEYGFPKRAAVRMLPLIRWQSWARRADVRKAAP